MSIFLQIIIFSALGIISLESQSEENRLVIPSGYYEGSVLDKHKLAQAIVDESDLKFALILKVYDLVVLDRFLDFLDSRDFTLSFTMQVTTDRVLKDGSFVFKTDEPDIYENIRCAVTFNPVFYRMDLRKCRSGQVAFTRRLSVHLKTPARNIFIEMVQPPQE